MQHTAGMSIFTDAHGVRQNDLDVLVSPALDRWNEKAGRLRRYNSTTLRFALAADHRRSTSSPTDS